MRHLSIVLALFASAAAQAAGPAPALGRERLRAAGSGAAYRGQADRLWLLLDPTTARLVPGRFVLVPNTEQGTVSAFALDKSFLHSQ
ncbi:MAG: hypothetical protein NVS9B10_14330 [Nevskia sp.]